MLRGYHESNRWGIYRASLSSLFISPIHRSIFISATLYSMDVAHCQSPGFTPVRECISIDDTSSERSVRAVKHKRPE